MNSKNSILSKLNPNYFWDVDLAILDDTNASRLIIDRVFSLGEIHEMNQVIHFYGKDKVVEVLSNLSYIDPKTLNFIIKLFNKPAEEFRCYQRKQSTPQHWNS
ncbi:MAG: hypothetical protein IH596_14370 [Bacteroidales bacterium]|nr:hypothetical protein [Bacteroidales bacterium]